MSDQPLNFNLTVSLPADFKIGERSRQILALRFEHPDWTITKIAEIVGVSSQRAGAVLNHPRVLAAMPHIARQRIAGMVPKATQKLNDLMGQTENLEVSRKVVERVLADKKVLDAPEIVVRHDISVKPTKELEEMIKSAMPGMPPAAIEAEYTESATQDTTHTE